MKLVSVVYCDWKYVRSSLDFYWILWTELLPWMSFCWFELDWNGMGTYGCWFSQFNMTGFVNMFDPCCLVVVKYGLTLVVNCIGLNGYNYDHVSLFLNWLLMHGKFGGLWITNLSCSVWTMMHAHVMVIVS